MLEVTFFHKTAESKLFYDLSQDKGSLREWIDMLSSQFYDKSQDDTPSSSSKYQT